MMARAYPYSNLENKSGPQDYGIEAIYDIFTENLAFRWTKSTESPAAWMGAMTVETMFCWGAVLFVAWGLLHGNCLVLTKKADVEGSD